MVNNKVPRGSSLIYNNESERDELIKKLDLAHRYTIAEAMYLLKVTRRTIDRWRYSGRISESVSMGHPCVTGDDIQRIYFS